MKLPFSIIVLKHDNEKNQVLLVPRRKSCNLQIDGFQISHQDTDGNHVILTNLIGGFRFSHQNGTGGIILGGHHVDGAYNQIPIRVADHITGGEKERVFHLKYRIGRMCHMRFNGERLKRNKHIFFQPFGLSTIPRFKFQKKIPETTSAFPPNLL